MAGLASIAFTLIILLSSASANAGDLFTGFHMDDNAEYFAYLGLKEDLPGEFSGLKGFVQLFASGQSYEYESNNQDIEADVQSLTPSLGVAKSLGDGGWTVSALAGPHLRWKKEDGSSNDSGRDFNVGLFVQAEAMYWQETGNFQAIFSYGSLDDFFFGRLRGKLLTFSPETGCCPLFLGSEVAGMGNEDFGAVQLGPVAEIAVGRVSLLARGGYQYDDNFGSGGYGGLELYMPF